MHTRFPDRAALALVVFAGVAALAGCRQPVFPSDQPRTQYDRYDAVRNQQAPPFIEDEFGRLRPNLRGRLDPSR